MCDMGYPLERFRKDKIDVKTYGERIKKVQKNGFGRENVGKRCHLSRKLGAELLVMEG